MRNFSMLRKIKNWAIFALVFSVILGAVRLYREKPWLPALMFKQIFQKDPAEGREGPVDIIFVFADHYEPHHIAAIERWERGYRRIADRHRDADGKKPQHTFFWYWDDSRGDVTVRNLLRIARLTYEGYGEVELHLHHDNDTPLWVTREIERRIRFSQLTGAFLTAEKEPRTTYGFIHGMWALDNSRKGLFCGVNSELEILRDTGCYADFTHSSWGPMNPRMVNALYYAKDDPALPKSYDRGRPVQVGKTPWGDLLIFQGPSVLAFERGRPRYDHGDVTLRDLPTPGRIERWIRTAIHVKGRPEWIFVKVFTHGAIARDHEALLGKWAEEMYETLEKNYNDGKRYRLHYATAREAYNILKAAEAGHSGNPNDYRDFLIPPYANQKISASVPYRLISYRPERIELASSRTLEGTFHFKEGSVEEVHGFLSYLLVESPKGTEPNFQFEGKGVVRVKLRGKPEPVFVDLQRKMQKAMVKQ